MSRVYDESSDRFVDGYWFLIISAVIGKGKHISQGLRVSPEEIEEGIGKVAQVMGTRVCGLWIEVLIVF